MSPGARIVLIVEDDHDIRESLAEVFRDEGFLVLTASDGRQALRILTDSAELPGVVLLDLMLPVMTGWELVSAIRGDDRLSAIPLIVTSAASDRAPPGVDRVLAKPISIDALIAAVAGYCEPKGPQGSSAPLRELARRNVELAELRRFRDEMSTMILHDLKNPLAVIEADVQYAIGRVAKTDPEVHEALLDAKLAVQRIGRIAENLLHLTRLETGIFLPRRTLVAIDAVLLPLVDQRRVMARERGLTIETRSDPHASPHVALDVDLVSRAVENLFDNAFRHTPPGGRILVETAEGDGSLRIAIGNSGAPIPPAARERLFDKYTQATEPGNRLNLGLGLYFCRLVAESHGGRIWIEERESTPFTVVIELPTSPRADRSAPAP